MRYTIEGFSQEYAITLRKNIISGGKEKLIKIDCTDLVILRWFVDFYPNMKKITVDGKEYAWLSHSKLADDLPLLDISKRTCIERMQKLVEFGILNYKLLKKGGTFSLYTFGNNYINLIRSNDIGGIRSNDIGGIRSNDIGAYVQTTNKDNSINNTCISKERKKAKTSFDKILSEYTTNTETLNLLKEWLKVRKAKRAAMTDTAIQLNINKLDKLAKASNMNVNDYLSEVICRGWAVFYEIRTYNQPEQNNGCNVFLELAKEEGVF